MKTPTRDDLQRLLFSDPASEAWEGDARKILEAKHDLSFAALLCPVAEGVVDLVEAVSTEIEGATTDLSLDPEEDLTELATAAKRGAVLLLHAAWAAEADLARMKSEGGSR